MEETPKKRGRPAKQITPEIVSPEAILTEEKVEEAVPGFVFTSFIEPVNEAESTSTEVYNDGNMSVEIPSPRVEIKEVIVEKEVIREVPAKKVIGWKLYKQLKDAGYPQGGMGDYWEDPYGLEKVYVPRPEELYGHFLGNADEWKALRDELARAWMEISLK